MHDDEDSGFALTLIGVAALLRLWLITGLSRPLIALESASVRLGHGDLTSRAPVEGAVAIAALARQFNMTAGRPGGLIAAQQEFVADASHQLRTPSPPSVSHWKIWLPSSRAVATKAPSPSKRPIAAGSTPS